NLRASRVVQRRLDGGRRRGRPRDLYDIAADEVEVAADASATAATRVRRIISAIVLARAGSILPRARYDCLSSCWLGALPAWKCFSYHAIERSITSIWCFVSRTPCPSRGYRTMIVSTPAS